MEKFKLRDYQRPIWDAVFLEDKKRVIAVFPRRAGKDFVGFNMAIFQCLIKTCLVMYVLPVFNQARGAIFDAITIDGQKFLDYLPEGFVDRINSHEMKIIFKNGSILQLVGGETHATSIRGRNPYAVILSEYAYFESGDVLDTVSPILAANKGWLLILSTPWGKNHYYELVKYAKASPYWTVFEKKTSEIQHISPEALAEERAKMSEEKYAQEYEISFETGVEGTWFGRQLERLRQKGQITSITWDPGLLTHLSLDIGVNDATTIIWFQVVGDGTIIRIIDSYSNNNVGLDHYAKVIQDKPYNYGYMFAPHDIAVREWSDAQTRFDKAANLGLKLTTLAQMAFGDSIENCLTYFPKIWIDAQNCKSLISALENYRKVKNEKGNMFEHRAVKNWAIHYADAFRYMCQAIKLCASSTSGDEYMNLRMQALKGQKQNLPKIFQYDPRYDR